MGRGKSGVSGAAGNSGNTLSPLEAIRNNARQFNEALAEGRARNAEIVEYTDIMGIVRRRYWNGATWSERPSSMYARTTRYRASGTYKTSYKE